MYLAEIEIENFRIFGSKLDNAHCQLDLNPGVNVFVGPNDAGKTCLLDAVRVLLGTSTSDVFAIGEDDFHERQGVRAKEMRITGVFRDLSDTEAGAFLEYLGTDDSEGKRRFALRVWMIATLEERLRVGARRRRVQVEFRAGPDAEGTRLDGRAREILNATYLKPLRDAVAELAAKRGSRLSQVLRAYREITGQDLSDWDPQQEAEPKTLVGIMRRAEHSLRNNPVIVKAERDLNDRYLREFSIGDSAIEGRISPSPHELQAILERLELVLSDGTSRSCRGLGIHNLLFIAAELLALGRGVEPELPMVIVEEPEAHLEPQRQLRLVDFLVERASTHSQHSPRVQLMVSTHSPNIASRIPLKSLIVVHRGVPYPLAPTHTMLEPSDYGFLERFLDVTKANLFFARGVLVVEGVGEALLLPVLANLIGRSLTKYGVSIINVGHVGLFRYSRIFRSKRGADIPVRVACIADRDIPTDEAASLGLLKEGRRTESDFTVEELKTTIDRKRKHDGGPVQTFVSPQWTLEYDLALYGLASYVHQATWLAGEEIDGRKTFVRVVRKARAEMRRWLAAGRTEKAIACLIYEAFVRRSNRVSKAEAAQWLAWLLEKRPPADPRAVIPGYLVGAIEHATGAAIRPSEGSLA